MFENDIIDLNKFRHVREFHQIVLLSGLKDNLSFRSILRIHKKYFESQKHSFESCFDKDEISSQVKRLDLEILKICIDDIPANMAKDIRPDKQL